MNKIINTVGTVVLSEGNVLLVRHGDGSGHISGTYGLPAGKIDQDESPQEAALRELKEETGLSGTDLKRLPTEYTAVLKRKDGEKEFHMIVFFCDKYEGDLVSSEETIPEWIDLNKVSELDLIPNVENAINQARNFNCNRITQ